MHQFLLTAATFKRVKYDALDLWSILNHMKILDLMLEHYIGGFHCLKRLSHLK